MKQPQFTVALAVELARRQRTRRDLARKLRVPPSTLSDWLHGIGRPPPDLARRIEVALDAPEGSISEATR